MSSALLEALRAEIVLIVRAELEAHAARAARDGLVDERELARIISVPVRTLQHWRLAGYGGPPYRKVGRAVRYSLADVEAWQTSRP